MKLIMLGIYPWNYSKLSDTVRSMIHSFQDHQIVYINPYAEKRNLQLNWKRRHEEGIEIWNPPFNLLPTRFGLKGIRDKLSTYLLISELETRFGLNWRDECVLYVTASTLELSYELVTILKPKRVLFDILDDNLGFPNITAQKRTILMKKFQTIAKSAEVLTAVSEYLVDQTQCWTGKEVKLLPNGVDVERFRDPTRVPDDLSYIPHPRLTFVGAVTSWIDLNILEYVAQQIPNGHIVMVGPVMESTPEIERLESYDNVHFLGAKEYAEVPQYMHASDVLLLPRTCDPYSMACDPIKLYEYLATGKPIVSTSHPSVQRFADVVKVAGNKEEFVEGIHKSLHRSYNETMLQLQKIDGLSWKIRADRLISFLTTEKTIASSIAARKTKSIRYIHS